MKTVLKLISFAGLGLMVTAAIMFFKGTATETTYHTLALIGTAAWFVSVPFWMKRRLHEQN
jgi:glucose dehydrogenase